MILQETTTEVSVTFVACKNIAEQFFTIHRISRDSFFHFNANLIPLIGNKQVRGISIFFQ